MSILKDTMDTLRDIDMAKSFEDVIKHKRYSSISARANEGTLQFPVLVTRNTDIKTAQTISKSLERKFASFVMISSTMSPGFVIRGEKADITDYLRRFHQNTNGKYTKQGFVNDIISVARENSAYIESDNLGLLFNICEGATGAINKDNKKQFESVLEGLKLDTLNDKFLPVRRFYTQHGILEAGGHTCTGDNCDDEVNRLTIAIGDVNIDATNDRGSSTRKSKDFVSDKIMRDNDIKKANELVPTTLHLKIRPMSTDGKEQATIDFLIGVKATLHGVESDDIITNMVSACRNKGKIFKFIKWTTGEISFAKDLVFNINSIKEDIARRSAGSSPWWLSLKRRRRLSRIKNLTMLPTGMLPNATIVVTMEEVNTIKQEYGFDLLNPVFVDKIMEEYFLLSFVVVDAPGEMAYFMFDGQKEYEIVTFDGLERDNANSKGIDAKEVVKMMNRI